MNVTILLGSLGGIIAALSAVIFIGRGIFRQVSATEDNTRALQALTAEVRGLKDQVGGHETRLSVLEDRIKRPR